MLTHTNFHHQIQTLSFKHHQTLISSIKHNNPSNTNTLYKTLRNIIPINDQYSLIHTTTHQQTPTFSTRHQHLQTPLSFKYQYALKTLPNANIYHLTPTFTIKHHHSFKHHETPAFSIQH